MKKFFYCGFMLVLLLMGTGCASKLMQPTTVSQNTMASEMASVTFFRYSSLGGAIQAPIVEVLNNDVVLVGIASVDTKIHYVVPAGKHTFVVGGESGSMAEGILDAGKHYYIRVEPRPGMFKARFALVPISHALVGSEKVRKELNTCKYVSINAEGEKWFLSNKASLVSKAKKAREDWDKKEQHKRAIIPNIYGLKNPI